MEWRCLSVRRVHRDVWSTSLLSSCSHQSWLGCQALTTSGIVSGDDTGKLAWFNILGPRWTATLEFCWLTRGGSFSGSYRVRHYEWGTGQNTARAQCVGTAVQPDVRNMELNGPIISETQILPVGEVFFWCMTTLTLTHLWWRKDVKT